MKLKLKHADISTGTMVCFLNKEDAKKLDLRFGERVRISKNKKTITCLIDTSTSSKIIPKGSVGLLNQAYEKLGVKHNSEVNLSLVEKPMSLHYIKKKLKGERLNDEEIYAIIKDIVDGNYSDVEITYFVSACYIHEMSMDETVALTNAIINTGDILKLKEHPIVDKHCVGGVAGNRTTMILVPILASLGFTIPKTSARSITSPAGTADTMEALCNVSFDIPKIKKIMDKTKACIVWGGAVNMAPADDRIIKVEHPVSLDPTGQLLASIMAKKKAVSSTHLIVDIPYGKGAKIEDKKRADDLKKKFEKLSRRLGITTKVIITDGSQPVGNGIGPVLEARDVLWVFERDQKAPLDLENKGIQMAAMLMELTKKATYKDGLKICREILESGKAYTKFKEMIKAQGGKITSSKEIKLAPHKKDIIAEHGGIITHVDNKKISRIARICGAPDTKTSGLYLNYHVGDKIEKGDVLMTLYSSSKDKLGYAEEFFKNFGGMKIN